MSIYKGLRYYKYVYEDWEQPVLTANGTMGGDSFAVEGSSITTGSAYYVINANNTSNTHFGASSFYYTFYSPNKLNVTKLQWVVYDANRNPVDSTILASNDGIDWVTIVENVTNSAGSSTIIDLSNNKEFYNYYKWQVNSVNTGSGNCTHIYITAQEAVPHLINLDGEDVYEDWQQPVLTANGTMGGDSFAVSASSYYDSPRQPFNAFDGKNAETSGCWHSTKGTTQWIAWYNPKPLKYSKITILNRPATPHAVKDYQIQVSDDGSIWETVYSGTNTVATATTSWDIDLSSIKPISKYMRLYADTSHGECIVIGEITITAQELTAVGGTKEDADYGIPIKILDSGRGVFVGSKNTNCLTYTPKHVDVELNPLNANVTGTWGVIADGVAKGFTTANYLTVPNTFDVTDGSSWEMVYKIRTGTGVSSAQYVLSGLTSRSCTVYIQSSRFGIGLSSASGSWNITDGTKGTYVVLPETDYWLKFSFNGSSYTLSYSLDGVDYINDITKETTSSVYGGVTLGLGVSRTVGESFTGIIYLSQSYIKINNELWWSGDNYNKVGSWIDNGVVGSFTSANYLKLPETFNPESNSWEMVFKVKTGTVGAYQYFIGANTSNRISVGLNNNNNMLVNIGSGSWTVMTGTSTLQADTEYTFKVVYDGANYMGYVDDNLEFTVASSITLNTALRLGNDVTKTSEFWKGVVDLSQSYIKINDEIWWQGGTGDVTLKQGSKVYVPNGWSDYDYYKYESWEQPVNPESVSATSGWTDFNNVFDGDDTTYAKCNSLTDYIEYDLGETVYVNGIETVGNWVNSTAVATDFKVYSVENDVETLLCTTTGHENSATYYTNAYFDGVPVTKLRFYITATYSGAPSRTVSIKVLGYKAIPATPDDYDYKIPKGHKVFNELVIPNDISAQSFANSEQVVCYNPTTNRLCLVGNDVYDSDNNVMNDNISLPVARCTADNVSVTSIDEVFDWCGRIGNTAFVLPDVKGFIAKGYKDTGTYNSTEFTTNKVLTADIDTVTDRSLLLGSDKLDYVECNYNKTDNLLYNTDGEVINAVECGKVTSDGTAITSLTPYTAQPLTTGIPIKFIYSGSQLVYLWQPYEPNTVILYGANTRTKTYELEAGLYQCCVVGGGWANRDNWSNAGGAAVEIQFRLTEKATVVVYSGGLGHTAYLNINGARVATANTASGQNSGGSYSINTASPYYVSTIVARNGGNANLSVAGSVSPYGGWGAGTSAGGVRLEYITY